MEWEKLRRKPMRLEAWDYSSEAWYYVTICTAKRNSYFGDIQNDQVVFSQLGQVAKEQWLMIPSCVHTVALDEFIFMPDHMHGIIEIIDGGGSSLSSIINSYKGAVTKWARHNGYANFAWQRGYFDHIIRDDKSLDRIREYIQINPLSRGLEKNHPENFG
jgi:REP element-mobilizing transposase RayT